MNEKVNPLTLVSSDESELAINTIKSKLMMRIKEYKFRNDLTQLEIAKKCNISQPRVSDILNGQFSKVKIDYLVSVCVALGIDYE